ncbi:tRNA-splicing endonuclease subunit Sen2-1-like [Wolffia australiana]
MNNAALANGESCERLMHESNSGNTVLATGNFPLKEDDLNFVEVARIMDKELESDENEVIDEYLKDSMSMHTSEPPIPYNDPELKRESLRKSEIDSGEEKKSLAEIARKQKSTKSLLATNNTQLCGPRWKGKGFSLIARDNPMSNIVKQLQNSLMKASISGKLSGSNVILPARSDQSNLLDRACFGRPISTLDRETTWFQLGPEEAFYLVHSLKCLSISDPESGLAFDHDQLWKIIDSSTNENFLNMYAAYAHLRSKNWVVRPGIQYGVDFVAYRHHPALVHSEYAVLVFGEDGLRPRLREWADLQGTLRVSGSVAKALLVITIKWNCPLSFPICLEQCSIEERVMERWIPQRNRDGSSQV